MISPRPAGTTPEAIAEVFRDVWGAAVGAMIRTFGDADTAEDAVQDAFAVALERWPRDGAPDDPLAWVTTVGRRRIIDRLRKQSLGRALLADMAEAAPLAGEDPAPAVAPMDDDRLRLVFMCCHPALAPESQVALTLKLLCGLTTAEIARAFLVPEATLAQRIARGKRKIRDAGVPFRVPERSELDERLAPVLATVYLVHNAGVGVPPGGPGTQRDLCDEARRLARLLAELYPREPEVLSLLALVLLGESRRPARFDAAGAIVVLADQDRALWDRDRIDEARAVLVSIPTEAERRSYRLQAEIQAVHCVAPSVEDTDWAHILDLYDELLARTRSPVVALNRAVALAEVDGPAAALEALGELAERLGDEHLFHATRGEMHRRLGQRPEAAQALERAARLAPTDHERRLLEARARGARQDSAR